MEDFDILKRFDNDKLIDVVKNYKRYGYDVEIRDYAINLLEERGWSVEDLKTFGYWENSDYEEALIQYKAYCRNSLIAVCVLVLSLCMLAPIYLVFVFMAYRNVCKFYQALGRKEEAVFSFDLCWHVLLFFYLKEKMKEELKGIYQREQCISEKVKNIIELCSLPEHRFFNVDVYMPKKRNKADTNYYALHYDFTYIQNDIL